MRSPQKRFRFGEPSDIVAQLSKLMANYDRKGKAEDTSGQLPSTTNQIYAPYFHHANNDWRVHSLAIRGRIVLATFGDRDCRWRWRSNRPCDAFHSINVRSGPTMGRKRFDGRNIV